MRRVFTTIMLTSLLVISLVALPQARVLAHPTLAPAQVTAFTTAAQIDAYLKSAGFHGYMLIARHGRTILSKGYGMADVAHKIPMTVHTRWPMYGVEHFIIALAVLKLQDEGRLRVHDKVCAYLTPCPDGWKPLTLSLLLTGTSGLGAYDDSTATGRVKDALATCVAAPIGTPGITNSDTITTETLCNNIVLAAVLEKAAGERFVTVLQTRVLQPAGMTDARFQISATIPPGSAQGYLSGEPAAPPTVPEIPRVFASPADVQHLDDALFTGKIISSASRRAMFTAYADDNPPYGGPWRGYGILFGKATRADVASAFSDAGTDNSGFLIDNGFSLEDNGVTIWMISDRQVFGEDAENAFAPHIEKLTVGK